MSVRTPYTIKGDTGDWELVMGLEVHAQVASNAKLFSGAATAFGAVPSQPLAPKLSSHSTRRPHLALTSPPTVLQPGVQPGAPPPS